MLLTTPTTARMQRSPTMLTPYGKLVRKHRIDKGITLREMSAALDVSPSFLSAIETGRRSVPREMLPRVVALLDLGMNQRVDLEAAAEASRREVKLHFDERSSGEDREIAAMFARRFPGLSQRDKEALRRILQGRRK